MPITGKERINCVDCLHIIIDVIWLFVCVLTNLIANVTTWYDKNYDYIYNVNRLYVRLGTIKFLMLKNIKLYLKTVTRALIPAVNFSFLLHEWIVLIL